MYIYASQTSAGGKGSFIHDIEAPARNDESALQPAHAPPGGANKHVRSIPEPWTPSAVCRIHNCNWCRLLTVCLASACRHCSRQSQCYAA